MRSFLSASRNRGRKAGLLFFLPLFLLTSLYNAPAFCASLLVKIHQINPAGATLQVTCLEHQKCVLPLNLQLAPPSAKTVNISMTFAQNNVITIFRVSTVILAAAEKGVPAKTYPLIWHKSVTGAGTYDITLYLTAMSNGIPTYQKVGDVELTVQPTS